MGKKTTTLDTMPDGSTRPRNRDGGKYQSVDRTRPVAADTLRPAETGPSKEELTELRSAAESSGEPADRLRASAAAFAVDYPEQRAMLVELDPDGIRVQEGGEDDPDFDDAVAERFGSLLSQEEPDGSGFAMIDLEGGWRKPRISYLDSAGQEVSAIE